MKAYVLMGLVEHECSDPLKVYKEKHKAEEDFNLIENAKYKKDLKGILPSIGIDAPFRYYDFYELIEVDFIE